MAAGVPLVVLDLNGCLLSLESRRHAEHRPDFGVGRRYVYLRPGVADFLAALDDLGCDVAVWTSRQRHNAIPLIARLPFVRPPAFVYCRDQASFTASTLRER
jgi:phosphoglycolate phosphatase-like HAD superfamily hydrolase